MTRSLFALCALLLATVAAAQMQVQPIKVAPRPQPAPTQATPVSPAVDEAAGTVQQEAPTQAIETVESLREANRQLREKNKALRNENAALKERLAQTTTRGGSLVKAWCPTPTVARTTAGDESNCAAGGYNCDPVSGQCRTTCQTSDHCSINFTCDPPSGKCISTINGAPGGED
jgi:hypothetical protein